MKEPVKYSKQIVFSCQPEVVERVDEAAAAKMMKSSEYIRRAIIDSLKADGMLKSA